MSKEIELIAQLLAKAESTEFAEERETFMRAAEKKAARLSIDLSVARAHKDGKEARSKNAPVKQEFDIGTKGDRGAGTYSDLLTALGEAHDMRWWRYGNERVDLVGLSFDMEYIEKVYPILLYEMVKGCQNFLSSGTWKSDGVTRSEARFSYCKTFAETVKSRIISTRLEARNEHERESGDSVALVVADQKKEIHSLFRSEYDTSKRFKDGRRVSSWKARAAGNLDGRNVSLHLHEEIAETRKLEQ